MSRYAEFSLKLLTLCAFLGVLVWVSYLQWFGEPPINRENRKLADQPSIPISLDTLIEFPQAFSDYMDDNFGYRSDLLRAYHQLALWMNTSPSEKVVLGKSDWLFYAHDELIEQSRGAMPLSEERLGVYREGFEAQRRWLSERDMAYIIFPTPDKNTLFPELLPDWVKQVGPSRLTQTVDMLKQENQPVVDALPRLQAAKENGESIYLRTDSHWNCLGAFRAYEALMDEVEKLGLPNITRIREQDIQFNALPPRKGGDMAKNMLLMHDLLLEDLDVECKIRNPEKVHAVRLSDGFVAKWPLVPKEQRERWHYRRGEHEPETRVVLIRDSYTYAMLPFLILSFDELMVISRPELRFEREFIDEHNPDLVVFQFVERALFWPPKFRESPGGRRAQR